MGMANVFQNNFLWCLGFLLDWLFKFYGSLNDLLGTAVVFKIWY